MDPKIWTTSVDSTVVVMSPESDLDMLRKEIKTLKAKLTEKDETISNLESESEQGLTKLQEVSELKEKFEALKGQRDEKIAKLEREQVQIVSEVQRALRQQQPQEEGYNIVDYKLEMLQDAKVQAVAQHGKNLAEIQSIQRELQEKFDEVKQLNETSERAEVLLKAEHSSKIAQLENKRKEDERKKDEETELWKSKSQQFENDLNDLKAKFELKVAELHAAIDEKERDVCALPPGHHLVEYQKLRAELDGQHDRHSNEIAELKTELDDRKKEVAQEVQSVNKLRDELDAASKANTELQTALERKHADDIAAMKLKFDEKLKNEELLKEQEMERKVRRQMKFVEEKLSEMKKERDTFEIEVEKFKVETKKLKKEAEKLREDAEKHKNDTMRKDTESGELEEQLKKLVDQLKKKDEEHKMHVDSMRAANDEMQRTYEQQLQEKSVELDSLTQHHEESQMLQEELDATSARLAKAELEKASLQSAFDKLCSDHDRLHYDYGQLQVEVSLKKHEEALACGPEWVSSEERPVEEQDKVGM